MNSQPKVKYDLTDLDFSKYPDKLIPAVVQDQFTGKVLMVGFMNREAVDKTIETGLVTFFSRSRQALWTKGETSNNFLHLSDIFIDCDRDTILIKSKPGGPVCHTGADTCFGETNKATDFLNELENIITDRRSKPSDNSYTSSLFKKGINAMAQKVGEEAVELVIEAKDADDNRFKNEAADLLFHYLILLQAKGFTLSNITQVLEQRHKKADH